MTCSWANRATLLLTHVAPSYSYTDLPPLARAYAAGDPTVSQSDALMSIDEQSRDDDALWRHLKPFIMRHVANREGFTAESLHSESGLMTSADIKDVRRVIGSRDMRYDIDEEGKKVYSGLKVGSEVERGRVVAVANENGVLVRVRGDEHDEYDEEEEREYIEEMYKRTYEMLEEEE